MTRKEAEMLLKSAVDFQSKSALAREKSREQYRKAEKEPENRLRITIDGLISVIAERFTQKIDKVTPEISYQLGVSVSFVRTHFIVYDLIMEGCIVEAIVLIRNQLESLARLHELDSKPLAKLAGQVPNIQNVLKGQTGRLYGNLSEVAHFSKPRVSELLHVVEDGERRGPSLLPVFHERNFAAFDMNCFIAIYFLAWLIDKQSTWYPGYDNGRDKQLLGHCAALALECGVIQFPEEPVNQPVADFQAPGE
jgi:hypothetical protein